jgi:ABC-2 type transport system permease protein
VGLLKSITRIYSQVRKELIQIIRRPGAFFSLVLGPFLIMALFGVGYTGVRRPLATVIVVPEELNISRDITFYQEVAGPALEIRRVDADANAAREELRRQQLDLIVTAPADAIRALREGRQANIPVDYNQVDPGLAAYVEFISYTLSQEINREIIRRAVEEGESYVIERLEGERPTRIAAEVIAAPTVAAPMNIAPSKPPIVAFFAPAVLALVLQHMAVTLAALSFVRERLSGTMELFRVSPVNSFELLLGKYVGFGIISAVIAAVVTALSIGVLGVPLLGDPLVIVAVLALVVFASLGLGLFISVVADSERQAVQLALLLLLASVFFSGFVLPVQEFRFAVEVAAYALPVTHGIRLLQDLMLRGGTYAGWQMLVLAGVGLALLVITTLLLRRALRKG